MTPSLPEPPRSPDQRGAAAGGTGMPAGEPPDLRAVVLGSAGWAGGLSILLGGVEVAAALLALTVCAGAVRRRRGHPSWLLVSCVVAFAAVAATALVGVESHRASALARLADAQAWATIEARVAADPVRREGRFAPYVLVRLSVRQVEGLGRSYRTDVPALLIGDLDWLEPRLGDVVTTSGRLRPPTDDSVSAVVLSRGGPTVVRTSGPALAAAEAVREGIRRATAHGSADARALVPALVVGDDRGMSQEAVEDFRTTGLTHLAAVSGTNLTLVVGFLLVVARAVGVRARGLLVVGVVGVLGFVVLARTEPSVLRAAVMGSIALVGMGSHTKQQGARALGVAVLVLLLHDPWLAISWGFALSVVATGGILFLAPGQRDAMMRWLPRWAAEAVAVPFAAQLACTPLIAALSGQVSLVAVIANMAVAAAVAPATVLGLMGGLLHLVVPALGALVGAAAVGCGWWIIMVAHVLAGLPAAAVEWSTGPLALSLLTVACVVVAGLAGRLLGARGRAFAAALLLVVVVLVPPPTPGWPPRGWVMVACDVGQGDGLVFNAGPGRALVVDTGPDPGSIDRCLQRLGVREVPEVVLTHFHADHVDGLRGVLDGRAVGAITVAGRAEPPGGAASVARWSGDAGVPVRVAAFGEVATAGPLTWQVVGPARPIDGSAGGSVANNASVVLLVTAEHLRILAAGDMERPAQAMLRRAMPGLRVDVLKVPHHGSADQDPALVAGLGARLAVVSVGPDNGYGHPAPSTLDLLGEAGMLVRRTDLEGDLAVLRREGRLRVAARG